MPSETRVVATQRNDHLRLPDDGRAVGDYPATRSSPPMGALPEDLRGRALFSEELARYMQDRFARAAAQSRRNVFKSFRLLWDFFEYERTDTGRTYLAWTSVDDGLLSRLISWMSSAEVGPRLRPATKAHRYNVIRAFFEWLKLGPPLLSEGWVVRRNPWPLSYHSVKSRDGLSEASLALVLKAAIQDIEQTIANWDKARAIIDDPLVAVPPRAAKISAYKSQTVVLKTLATAFSDRLPTRAELMIERRGLYDALRTYPTLSYGSAIKAIVPTARLIAPFVVLIALATLFNPETILKLRWSHIDEEHPVFGADRWRLRGDKPRSGREQVRSFPARVTDLTNPISLLKLLRQQTARLRDELPQELRDYVFVFRVENRARATAFVASDSSRTGWSWALRRFIDEYQLEPFTLADLRPAGSDLVDELTGGNLLAQQMLLNHAKPETTAQYYTSHAARARRQEKLAQAMEWRERYARSGGKVDPRGQLGSSRAATPGYECFDPYDSPVPGQVAGRLCSAYGHCPSCSLHAVNFSSPKSLARIIQLAARLDEASEQLATQRWLSRWVPVQKAVRKHLYLFTEEIYTAARQLQLPPIPEIE